MRFLENATFVSGLARMILLERTILFQNGSLGATIPAEFG